MKKIVLFFACIIPFLSSALDVSVSHATFYDLENPYVEIYISVVGQSLATNSEKDSLFFSKVYTFLTIEKDGQIIKAEKFNIVGPTTNRYIDFVDQKRFGLPNGDYTLNLKFEDVFDASNILETTSKIHVDYKKDVPQLGDIQMLYSYKESKDVNNAITKNGYLLEPLPFNFLDRGEKVLKLYTEIYNTKTLEDGLGLFRYYIYDNYSKRVFSVGNKKLKNDNLEVFILNMDISKLPSGNFSLITELRNKKNEIVSKKSVDFQRSNPFITMPDDQLTAPFLSKQFVSTLTRDQLKRSLASLTAIAESTESLTISELLNAENNEIQNDSLSNDSKNVENMRRFLFSFFVKRDPNLPEVAYIKYMSLVGFTEKQFGTSFRKGYLTDRGVLYLKYGAPSDIISVSDEPVLPYEIWMYNELPTTKQTHVKYLFYNNTLTSNDFVLLHSTENGNVQNPNWFNILSKNNSSNFSTTDNIDGSIDAKISPGSVGSTRAYGTKARQYFDEI